MHEVILIGLWIGLGTGFGTVAIWAFQVAKKARKIRQDHKAADQKAIIDGVVAPIQLIVDQLTKNGNKNDPPTVPDQFHSVTEAIAEVKADVAGVKHHLTTQDTAIAEVKGEVSSMKNAAERRWEEHYAYSDEKISNGERRQDALEQRQDAVEQALRERGKTTGD